MARSAEGRSETRWRRDPGVPFQRMDDEIIVVDPRTREVHLLNGTATHIWDLLQSECSLDGVVTALAAEYDGASADTLRAEVQSFIVEMRAKGLVHATNDRKRG